MKWICKDTGQVFRETKREAAGYGTHEFITLVSEDGKQKVRVSNIGIQDRFGPEPEPDEVAS